MTRSSLNGRRRSINRLRWHMHQSYTRAVVLALSVAIVLLVSQSRAFLQVNSQTGPKGKRAQGTQPSGARPKQRTSGNRAANSSRSNVAGPAPTLVSPFQQQNLLPVLATADFDLIGLAATAGPATQTVPKNTPTIIQTGIQAPEGVDPRAIIAGLNPNYRIRGELTGPSLTSPLTLEAAIGQPLNIPPLANAGDHIVQNLRVVDTGASGEPVVTSVSPDLCGIVVIEQVLVSEVRVQELSYDQIVNSGININDDSYNFFNFIIGLSASSSVQNVQIPVAFPPNNAADPRPVIGNTNAPVGTTVPDVFPVMLELRGSGNVPSEVLQAQTGGQGGIRIPGVIVFPGRVGFLQQHFEAIVIVANGSPATSNLVVRQLRARVVLPNDPQGPPLVIAETQTGGRVEELEIHGLGPDGRYGTADDTTSFPSGASGQASFLFRGIRQGLHTINFELNGRLEGLPTGPIDVIGRISGAVLVRDASIAISFTHPSVVQQGQDYDLSMTLFNQGGNDIQGAITQLAQSSIIGASLLNGDDGNRAFPTTIGAGQSATISWRLRANRTGAVTASYMRIGSGASASFGLATGIGASGVPLSPDSLALPESTKYLPPDVLGAARTVLGQAWSIATAPSGTLPNGVRAISKQTVRDRAIELGIAGLRVRFGEPVHISLSTLMRDWLSESQSAVDQGFADVLRNTSVGYRWYDTVGAYFYNQLRSTQSGLSLVSLYGDFVNAEMPRSPFISALVTQADGQTIVGASLIDSTGKRVGLRGENDERSGDVSTGGYLKLNENPDNPASQSLGQLLFVSSPGTSQWIYEMIGRTSGTVNVSLVIPASSSTYRQIVFNNATVTQGGRYRVVFRPFSVSQIALQEFRNGSYVNMEITPVETFLSQPQPRLVGAVQISPDVLDGGDKYGRLIGVLYSKPMAKDSIESTARYQIGGGALVGQESTEMVGGPIRVTGGRSNYGDRFAFLSLDSPVGPYIARNVTVNGALDKRGARIDQDSKTIAPTVSMMGNPPGAYLTGRVLAADNTPVANAPVVYWTQPCPTEFILPRPTPISTIRSDAQGRYAFDYVRDGDCGSVTVSATHPVTGSTKQLQSSVFYDGQHMVLDPVFLARGRIQGTITLNNNPAPNAYVRVVPEFEVDGTQLVQADAQGRYLNRNTQHWHTVFLDQYMAKACKGCIPRKLSTLQVYQCPVLRFSSKFACWECLRACYRIWKSIKRHRLERWLCARRWNHFRCKRHAKRYIGCRKR